MSDLLTSVTLVVLVNDGKLDANVLHTFLQSMSNYCANVETIIVANGISDQGLLALKLLVSDVPDCTCFVIADTIDEEAARIFGMEAAIGDYVLLVNGNALSIVAVALPTTIRSLQDGFDLAIALPRGPSGRRASIGIVERIAYRLLSKLSGYSISRTPSDLFALSRDAMLYILSKPNAELLLKAHTAGRGFPTRKMLDAYSQPLVQSDQRSFVQRAAKAVSLVVSIGAYPIRVVSVVSLSSGILSILYAAYVITIYMLKPNVAPGWTTLSLQLSGMNFLFSVIWALLSEYIIQIYVATASRRRRFVVRELRSERTARADHLNVTDASGSYRFGRP